MCIFTLKMHVMWFEIGHRQKCTSEHSQHAVHFFSDGFHVRFVQISRKGKNIIHLLDKIKCLINSTHDLEILSQFKLGKLK